MAAATPDQSYVNAVGAITGFADGVVSQGAPPVPPFPECAAAAGVLTQMKEVGTTWIGHVYPQLLQVPRSIVERNDTVVAGIATLASVAQQLEADPGNAQLAQDFSAAAKALSGTVAPLAADVHQLSRAVAGFAEAVNGGSPALQGACAKLEGCEMALAMQASQDEAVARQERAASYPSEEEEEAAEAASESSRQVGAFQEQMQSDVSLVLAAASGLAYAEGRWQALDVQAQATIATLEKIQGDPVGSLAVDLAAARQGWTTFISSLETILDQVAAAAVQGAT